MGVNLSVPKIEYTGFPMKMTNQKCMIMFNYCVIVPMSAK